MSYFQKHVQMKRNQQYLLVLILFVSLFLTACGVPEDELGEGSQSTSSIAQVVNEPSGKPVSGGKITFGLHAETDGWDPVTKRWGTSGYVVGFSIYDPLAAWDNEGNIQPYLAKSFDHNEDFTRWTIALRSGINFHDGSALTADVVAANLKAQKASPLTGVAFDFVKDIFVTSPLVVTVEMKKPWSTFPAVLAAQTGVVAPMKMFENPDNAKDLNENPIGTGPFKMKEWVHDTTLTVVKNDSYWRAGFPYLDEITFKVLPDYQTRGQSFEAKNLDIMNMDDPGQILKFSEKAKQGAIQMFTTSGESSKIFIGLNTAKAPFNDENARKALAYASNAEELSQSSYQGVFPAVKGPISPFSKYFSEPEGYPTQDLEKAREYHEKYKAAHGGQPLKFKANIIPAPEISQVGQVLQQQLQQIGIEVELNPMDQITLIVAALSGNYEATGFIWFGEPTLDRNYPFIAGETQPVGSISLNFTRFEDPILTAAMDKIRTTDDVAVHTEQYKIVQAQLAKNLNYLWLVQQRDSVIFQNDVHGARDYLLPDGTPGMQDTKIFTFNLWKQP